MIWTLYILLAIVRIFTSDKNTIVGWVSLLCMTPLLALLLITPWTEIPDSTSPHLWVLLALGFGYAGEWALRLSKTPNSWLVALHSIGYLCYSKAIWLQLSTGVSWWLPIVVIAVAIIVMLLLLPVLDKVLVPVLMMGIMLLQMLSVSMQVWLSSPSAQHLYTVVGSLLFIGAGLLLAVYSAHRIKHYSWHAKVAFIFYFSAQFFMVFSLV